MIVQHLLALYLIVITPIWDHFAIRKLKTGADPRRKVKFYWLVMAATWTASVVACLAVGWRRIFWIHLESGEISRLPPGTGANSFMVGLLVAFAAGVLAPAILIRSSPRYAVSIEKAMKPLQFILPATGPGKRLMDGDLRHGWNWRGDSVSRFPHATFPARTAILQSDSCCIAGLRDIWNRAFESGREGNRRHCVSGAAIQRDLCDRQQFAGAHDSAPSD
jgi:hypothetical protein